LKLFFAREGKKSVPLALNAKIRLVCVQEALTNFIRKLLYRMGQDFWGILYSLP